MYGSVEIARARKKGRKKSREKPLRKCHLEPGPKEDETLEGRFSYLKRKKLENS